ERGGAHQITEQDGELPPFRVRRTAGHRWGEDGYVVEQGGHAVVHSEGRYAVQRGGRFVQGARLRRRRQRRMEEGRGQRQGRGGRGGRGGNHRWDVCPRPDEPLTAFLAREL